MATTHPPIIRSHRDYSYSEEDDNNIEKNDQHTVNEPVQQLFAHLNDGAIIEQVFDNDSNITPISFTRSVILRHRDGTLSQHQIVKFQPGPLQSYYDSENNAELKPGNVLTADSQLVFIEQSFENVVNNNENDETEDVEEENEVSGVLKLCIYFLDLTHKSWNRSTHRVPVWGNFGTHTFTLHQSQLLLAFNRPLKIVAFDFNGLLLRHEDVIKYDWKSDAIVTRILSCLNFVLLFTNQNEFLSLTFNKSRVIESRIRKPCTSLKEEYDELVQIVNVGGKIVLIAQKDNKLLFLRIKNDIFVPIKSIDLTLMKYFQSSYPLIIKNMMSWRRSRLFIPVAVMKKSFPEDDQVLSESASVVEVDLNDFSAVSISQIESKVDIYQEAFHLTLIRHGTMLLARKERKSADRKKARATSNHLIKLKSSSLEQVCLSVLTKDGHLSSAVETEACVASKHFCRLVFESYDF